MDKLLEFVCALLCVLNAEAAIAAWAAKGGSSAITVTGAATATASASITLPSSTAIGATLFTLTATASPAIASYTFDPTDGNPSTHGAIALSTIGAVTLAKAIDYPTVKQVTFKVVATDTAAATGLFTMTVNFGPSTDSAYSFCVADPTASGTLIGKATSSVSTGVWTLTGGIGGDQSKFAISADGSITTAAILDTNAKVHYTATLVLADGTSTTDWPLHVLVDNSCLCSGVVHVISGVAMIVMTVLASIVI